jgi:hypothetical protein
MGVGDLLGIRGSAMESNYLALDAPHPNPLPPAGEGIADFVVNQAVLLMGRNIWGVYAV